MNSSCTEEQIITSIAEGQAGMKVEALCRQRGISKPTYYLWKNKYANMTISAARRVQVLEAEHSKLKRLVADQQLDILVLKDIISKKW